MTRFTREELLELAPAHALGATTPEEAEAMERAMQSDAALAAEVAALRAVPAVLASAAPVAPHPRVREALLAAVRSAAPVRTAGPMRVDRPVAARLPRWVPTLVAASLVLAVSTTVYGVRTRRDAERLRAGNADLATQLARRERVLNSLLDGEGQLYLVQVGADSAGTGPGLQFYWNARQGKALAHVFRLKPAPAGRDYQIWALVDGKPVSLAVFNSDAEGDALVEVEGIARSVRGVTAVLVSVEPSGGSVQPTSAPFLAGTFPGA